MDGLYDDDDRPDSERALLAETVEEYLSHRLTYRAVQERIQGCAHAECQGHIDRWIDQLTSASPEQKCTHSRTPAKDAGNPNRIDDCPRYSSGSVRSLLTDVDAGVERTCASSESHSDSSAIGLLTDRPKRR